MNVPLRQYFLLCVAMLLFAVALPVFGQQPDIRLSSDAVLYEVPVDLRIQDAAQIGNVSLAVWGTVRSESDTTVIGELVWQMRRDTTTIGSPERAHSEAARPFGVVSVVTVGSRFLVLWNDRRGGNTAIYAREFDTGGVWSGEEYLYSEGRLASSTGSIAVTATAEDLLLWNDNRTQQAGLYGRRFNRSSQMWGSEFFIDSMPFFDGMRYDGLGSGALIWRKDGSALVVSGEKDLTISRTPDSRFEHAYHIDKDGELAILRDSVIYIYKTVFDSVPYEHKVVHGIIHPSPTWRWNPDQFCIIRDSNGTYGVVYPWMAGGYFIFLRTIIVSDSESITVQLKRMISGDGQQYIAARVSNETSSIKHNCDNSYTAVWGFVWNYYPNPLKPPLSSGVASMSINIGQDGYELGQLPDISMCGLNGRISVQRTRNDTISEVTISGWGPLSSIVPAIGVRVSHTYPVLTPISKGVYVTWRDAKEKTNYPLYFWPDPNQTVSKQVDNYMVPLTGATSTYAQMHESRLFDLQDQALILYAQAISSYGETVVAHQYAWHSFRNDYLIVPSDTGWSKFYVTSKNIPPQPSSTLIPPVIDMVDKDILTQNIVVAAGSRDYSGTYMSVFGKDGKQVWSMKTDSYRPDSDIMQLGVSDVAYLADNVLERVRNGAKEPSVALQTAIGSSSSYRRLFDSSFIVCRYDHQTGKRVHLYQYGFKGGLKRDVSLNYSAPIVSATIRLNTQDSTIALLCSTSKGVRLTYLDKNLNVKLDLAGHRLHNIHINSEEVDVQNASGIFRNDTLLIVWEDYRYGDNIADVYGNYWVIPKTLPWTVEEDYSPISITTLGPNPTRDIVDISIESLDATEIQLAMFNIMGERVWDKELIPLQVGTNNFTVDTNGLPPGSYVITAQSGKHIERRKLIILRR